MYIYGVSVKICSVYVVLGLYALLYISESPVAPTGVLLIVDDVQLPAIVQVSLTISCYFRGPYTGTEGDTHRLGG